MYIYVIVALTVVLPFGSASIELAVHPAHAPWLVLAGKWLTFWAVGVRMVLAGIRQITRPAFTAEKIFGLHYPASLVFVRELGVSNLAIGVLGTVSLLNPNWMIPAALTGAVFYSLAGVRHALGGCKTTFQRAAMITDIYLGVVLSVVASLSLLSGKV